MSKTSIYCKGPSIITHFFYVFWLLVLARFLSGVDGDHNQGEMRENNYIHEVEPLH